MEKVLTWRVIERCQADKHLSAYLTKPAIDNLTPDNGFVFVGVYGDNGKHIGVMVYRVDTNLDNVYVVQFWVCVGAFDLRMVKPILMDIADKEDGKLEVLSHRPGFDKILENQGFMCTEKKWRLSDGQQQQQ